MFQWLAAKAAHQRGEQCVEREMRIDNVGGARLPDRRSCVAQRPQARRLVHGPSDEQIGRRLRHRTGHDGLAALQPIIEGPVQPGEVPVQPPWLIWKPSHSQEQRTAIRRPRLGRSVTAQSE